MANRLFAADVVVRDIKAAAERYSKILGVGPHWKYYPETPGVTECAFYPGDSKFVLITSNGDDVYAKFLKEKGEGLIGIYFMVDDLEAEAKRLRGLGVEFTTAKPTVFPEGTLLTAIPNSIYGVDLTGWVEPRADLPWGKTMIAPEGFPGRDEYLAKIYRPDR
jgi:catechol 2,3-dioxygenase-like lactoylglutathione lyase family enzyme